jgi:hypothetical protein
MLQLTSLRFLVLVCPPNDHRDRRPASGAPAQLNEKEAVGQSTRGSSRTSNAPAHEGSSRRTRRKASSASFRLP